MYSEYTGIAIALIVAIVCIRNHYAKKQRTKNRKYNQFGKQPLTVDETKFVKRWIFDIPRSLQDVVGQKISPEDIKGKENAYDDYELRVAFDQ